MHREEKKECSQHFGVKWLGGRLSEELAHCSWYFKRFTLTCSSFSTPQMSATKLIVKIGKRLYSTVSNRAKTEKHTGASAWYNTHRKMLERTFGENLLQLKFKLSG